MEIGDVYKKHVRGSRYVYNNSTIYYEYRDIRIPTKTDVTDIVKSIIEARGEYCGRIIINEEGEIITYKKQGQREWIPLYAGRLERELKFDQVDINPKNIKFGLLWPGFLGKHGSKYKISKKGGAQFWEKVQTINREITYRYSIMNFDKTILNKILILKRGFQGSFWINEYKHIWTSVPKTKMEILIKKGIISNEAIKEQISKFSNLQKTLIEIFSTPIKNRFNNRQSIACIPIYVGKYEKTIEIDRENEPKVIYSVDDNYDRWID